jgi:UDP-N-acetylmuramoyl-tripeptide--D-alanyl-D-alanine ligase
MTEALYEKYLACAGVSTDTRSITPNALFFALKGPNFNANAYASQALEKGAKFALIDEEKYETDDRFILVEDVLTTLQQLANHHRKQLNIPFIGINGTNGKTTTKELVNAVLSKKYKTHATKGNLNNHIGVPLTLLSIHADTEIAVIEMGANKVGDIAELCQIAEPTHGLTTNIGKAHLEGFGGFEGAIRGESELYHYFIQSGGTAFINSQDPILANMSKRFEKPLFYPAQGDYLHCELLGADPFIVYRDEQQREIHTQLLGTYNFNNIAAALCIGKYFSVPAEAANDAVKAYNPTNKRSEVVKKGSNTIILDAYNANPDSMKAAIENLRHMEAPKKAVLLGDMYELGDDTEKEHQALGQLLNDAGFDQILLCGKYMLAAASACPQSEYFSDKKQLEEYIQNNSFESTTLLIKASRGMALETLVDKL